MWILDLFQKRRTPQSAQDEQKDVQKIVDNMAKITALKVDAKKSIILENNAINLDKLTCYLNVINYFEEITTNLTDIILNIANIETKKDI